MIVHTTTVDFTCDLCGRGFKRHTDLKRHERIHAGTVSRTCVMFPLSFFFG
ncbi:hypothetical protein SmJEL517_g04118 [Synchytrium microbalum]|uniref:C2H2-type domain-containing protein n=1 Tax=Synchytrium microbalum TaxID=1806994 RepID=A0A507C5S0_9FUNG|nr:uncharacterized protein SmJEL517_g04118 [Synchytrium microbalum]TPX32815.1 hypothetical protein SmJEL517_g04118 [Synchytrium microbalum]